MKILHLCTTMLAGSPSNISGILNKYGNVESKTVLEKMFSHKDLCNLSWHYDYVGKMNGVILPLIEWADIVVHHQRPFFLRARHKIEVIQYHADPSNYTPGTSDSDFNGRKLVVANYQANFYLDAIPVPNMIDIWDGRYLPAPKDPNKIRIFFSYASHIPNTPSDKGVAETKECLVAIKKKFPQVDYEIMTNTPFNELMEHKRSAHITIDEIKTGACHLSSFEGISVGAVTINNISPQVEKVVLDVTGAPSTPFVKSDASQLFNVLSAYIQSPSMLAQKGKESRQWAERYFDPKIMVQKYLNFYNSLIQSAKPKHHH